MKVIFVCCCGVKMFEVTSRTLQCQAVEGSALQRLPKVGDPESLSQMHEILFQEERQRRANEAVGSDVSRWNWCKIRTIRADWKPNAIKVGLVFVCLDSNACLAKMTACCKKSKPRTKIHMYCSFKGIILLKACQIRWQKWACGAMSMSSTLEERSTAMIWVVWTCRPPPNQLKNHHSAEGGLAWTWTEAPEGPSRSHLRCKGWLLTCRGISKTCNFTLVSILQRSSKCPETYCRNYMLELSAWKKKKLSEPSLKNLTLAIVRERSAFCGGSLLACKDVWQSPMQRWRINFFSNKNNLWHTPDIKCFSASLHMPFCALGMKLCRLSLTQDLIFVQLLLMSLTMMIRQEKIWFQSLKLVL